jgi:hypothetical protein
VQDGYVSFAPVQSGSVYGPGRFYPLSHDIDEYDKPADDGARGYWIGRIFGLDTVAMMKELQRSNRYSQMYSVTNECATQVHKNLRLGGGDRFAGLWSRHAIAFWSPDDVEDYAKSIVAHTRHLGSYGIKVIGAGTVF